MSKRATIFGYLAGTWAIDTANSDLSFTARYPSLPRAHVRRSHH